MMPAATTFPRYRPVADHALLVEFGDEVGPAIYEKVWSLDAALTAHPIAGVAEVIPAYASLLIDFDPVITDHPTVERAVGRLLAEAGETARTGTRHHVQVCYDEAMAPDLKMVAAASGLSQEAVIATHLAGTYRVVMYGFAPGYAYLAGVPDILQLPRKPAPSRNIPAGSVLIAGPQCLVTTITSPTGWWIIGRSPSRILREHAARPVLFDIGDTVRFIRIDRQHLDAGMTRG
jgi:inhibitor of KinA